MERAGSTDSITPDKASLTQSLLQLAMPSLIKSPHPAGGLYADIASYVSHGSCFRISSDTVEVVI